MRSGRGMRLGLYSQAILVLAAVLWTLLLVIAPYSASHFNTQGAAFRLTALAFAAASHLCHQRADRSFHVTGVQMPVCARCFGLYASAAAGAIVALVVSLVRRREATPSGMRPRAASMPLRAHGRLILVAAVPTVSSVAAEALGIWAQDPITRSIAAVPLGLVVGWFVTHSVGSASGAA